MKLLHRLHLIKHFNDDVILLGIAKVRLYVLYKATLEKSLDKTAIILIYMFSDLTRNAKSH